MDEFEAFEHLLIYVYSLEKNVFLTKKTNKKSYGKRVDPPPPYGKFHKKNVFFLLKPSLSWVSKVSQNVFHILSVLQQVRNRT